MPDRLFAIVKGVAWVVTAVVALALWGARTEYQLTQKANQSEVDFLQQNLETRLERVDERTARVEAMLVRFICAERPRDLACGR